MSDRSYTVSELDALRRAVETKYLYGWYRLPDMPGGSWCSRSTREDEMSRVVEDRVRTHMLAGHTAEDLAASEDEHRRAAEASAASRL